MTFRPESSVSPELDEYGQLVFSGDRPSLVIHRTPEELGIPRTIKDVPPRPVIKVRPDFAEPRRIRSYSHRVRVKRDPVRLPERPCEIPVQTIRGVEVRMPAESVIGAELIDLLADEARENKVEGESEMPNGIRVRLSDEARLAIAADLKTMSAQACADKHGVHVSTVYTIKASDGNGSKPKPQAKLQRKTAIRPVEIDSKRDGTAASLLNALAKQDAAVAIVNLTLALNMTELAAVIDKLGPVQKTAFVSAGLKAALLA